MATESYRVSHIAWPEPNSATAWNYHKVGARFARASRHYGFDLIGLADALQYTVYGLGQHFNWHMDLGPAITSTRKLSMTIQLSAPDEYTGVELQFLNASPVVAMGTAICFPSFMAHRVAPGVTGTRRSLVAWANGPAFR
jgi:PKHD-type hydroxylase